MGDILDLSIVIPTYNEKENIKILIPRLETALRKAGISCEIVIVDDNSPDKTIEVARNLNKKYKNIVPILRIRERGIASAWYRGYLESCGDKVATMDADLCHSPEDLLKMYRNMEPADIIIGSRYMNRSGRMKDKSIMHIIASKFGQYFIRATIGIHQTDATHSFRIFKREVFLKIKKQLRTSGNAFLVMFLYLAKKHRYRIKEIPIKYGKRVHGTTKLNLYRESGRFIYQSVRILVKEIFR